MERRDNLIIGGKPILRKPYMVCGIGGWVDGGEASTGSVGYLIKKLRLTKFAEIPIASFHVFQVPGQVSLRPQVRVEGGILKEHHFPQNQFFSWVNPSAENDLLLFLGTEPNLNWEEYADILLDVADDFAVARIYLLGGVLDKTPHSREPAVTCSCSSQALKEDMMSYGVQFSGYEGPGSFGTTLLYMCQKKKLPMVSMNTRATYYPEFNIVVPHNPKSIRALMKRLNRLLHLELDLSDLDREADEFEAKLGFMVSHNPEFRAYVEALEKDFVEVKYEEPLDISAEEGVRIAEELLRGEKEDKNQG